MDEKGIRVGVVRGTTAQHAPPGKIAVAQFFGLGDACQQPGSAVGIGRQQALGGIEYGTAGCGGFVGASCCKQAEEQEEREIE
ncbi:hypothetical protein JCM16496A_22910 [Bacteroides rodentium JCM 16496]